jgi:hypothetical protein
MSRGRSRSGNLHRMHFANIFCVSCSDMISVTNMSISRDFVRMAGKSSSTVRMILTVDVVMRLFRQSSGM